MTKLEETIGTILDSIHPQLADSTFECRREVFGQLTSMADKMGITEPCQKLYDAFAKDERGSKQRRSMHLLIIKMLDAKAGTQGLTLGGRFINEPKFPTKDEVDTYLSSAIGKTQDAKYVCSYQLLLRIWKACNIPCPHRSSITVRGVISGHIFTSLVAWFSAMT